MYTSLAARGILLKLRKVDRRVVLRGLLVCLWCYVFRSGKSVRGWSVGRGLRSASLINYCIFSFGHLCLCEVGCLTICVWFDTCL